MPSSTAPIEEQRQRRRGGSNARSSSRSSRRHHRPRPSTPTGSFQNNENLLSHRSLHQLVQAGAKPRMLSATLWAASGAAVLMLSSSGQLGSFGSTAAGTGNLRHSRRLAAASSSSSDAPRGSSSRRLATVNEVDPAIVQTVQRLAEPFLADESNIFAFDETDPRPVVNTFFAIPEGRQISQIDAETLAVWKQAWSGAGWNPRILSIKDAEAHPNFADFDTKLKDVPLGDNVFYDRSCYLRHVAMAASGGGWMTDYDTSPLNIDPAVYGSSLPNDGQFTTYETHVPSLIVGNSAEWERVATSLVREGMAAKGRGESLFSDMHALLALTEKKEVIVHYPLAVRQATEFMEVMSHDLDANWVRDMMRRHGLSHNSCEETKDILALHFSHASTDRFDFLEARPLLIAEFLTRWSKLCEGPDFNFDSSASTASSGGAMHNNADATDVSLYDTDGTMAISRENSFLYVHVPQTGGLIVENSPLFNDAWPHHEVGSHHDIESMTKDSEKRGISDFTKAAHIRHPCDRFIDAYEFMTSDQANHGDKTWAGEHIGDKSIDEFVAEIEKTPEELLREAHFSPMWNYLFHSDGTYGLDITMCQETWTESLDKLSSDFQVPVPDELKINEAMTHQQSKCQDLSSETVAAIERIYHMDYCIFGYDALPQTSCPLHGLSRDDLTQRYKTCSAQKEVSVSKLPPAKSPIVDEASLRK